MESFEVLGTVWFWVIMTAIIAVHILSVPVRKLDRVAQIALTSLNAFLHLLIIGCMLASGAEPEELFFALLLSVTAALFTTKKRGKGADEDGI